MKSQYILLTIFFAMVSLEGKCAAKEEKERPESQCIRHIIHQMNQTIILEKLTPQQINQIDQVIKEGENNNKAIFLKIENIPSASKEDIICLKRAIIYLLAIPKSMNGEITEKK